MLLLQGSVVGLVMAWMGVVWSLPIQPASLILAGLGVWLLSPLHHLKLIASGRLNRARSDRSNSARPLAEQSAA